MLSWNFVFYHCNIITIINLMVISEKLFFVYMTVIIETFECTKIFRTFCKNFDKINSRYENLITI